MSFSQALSGLNSQAQKLGTIGNNIANSQTVGFKSSNVQFSDVFAGSKVGLGTRVASVLQNFNEGNVESTNRNLDLAIAGDGFFRFQDPSGEVVYSRNGQLSMTSEGNLINSQGAQIMGFGLNAAGQVQVGGQPVPLNVSAEELDASATTRVGTTINLDARKAMGEGLSTVEATDSTGNPAMIDYHYSNNFTVFDSLGNPRNITVYYEKTAANEWTAKMTLDGTTLDDGGAPANVTEYSVRFDSNGKLVNGGGDVDANGAIAGITFDAADYLGGEPENLTFDLNLAGTTQFGNTSTVSSLNQNGYTSGTLVGITINDDGTIMRNYSNEQSRPAGQVALVSFRNPEGLTPAGDNVWSASATSGQELIGAPGTGLLGSVVSGAVETSNVDMARELVDMIVAQRAYQANSQTIKTQDELLQTAINLR
ncbi:flagellar hook protein FlgE [Billgrantia montanilacus]|uniref:Flagellar hook protein FlgE n=1 Tax=Billgrantia montanilacus TaxID=2282305 RepID=A0A368U311_9GAMM|nr:flagellar hook protein FlgE [Halomonas montanilacus]RCV90946.1 flagellar hook protein FlgE [Halomonas montanilacus]